MATFVSVFIRQPSPSRMVVSASVAKPSCSTVRTRRWVVSLALSAIMVVDSSLSPPALAVNWWFSQEAGVEKDPVEPFTIYGSIFKKYLIEQIENGKIVSRRKGFTASACLNVLEASRETPELQGVPAGLKVTLIGDPCCEKGEGQSREDSCSPPCEKACAVAVSRHLRDVNQRTGYELDEADVVSVKTSCSAQCFRECTKPGKSISFILPFRPRR